LIQLERFSLKLGTAIRFYTAGSAYSTRGENTYGTLEPGKRADSVSCRLIHLLKGWRHCVRRSRQ
jgi:cytosine/adenosine deaminase-related metal-dependent hydrolase